MYINFSYVYTKFVYICILGFYMYKHKLYIRASGGCIGRREGGLGEEWCWEERAAREEEGGGA